MKQQQQVYYGNIIQQDEYHLTNIHNLENHLRQETKEFMNFDKKLNYGRWTINEQILYVQFSQINYVAMSSKKNRRLNKIFREMAKNIITRSPDQCRSHHQKMQRKYGQIFNIVSHCKRIFQKSIRKQQIISIKDNSLFKKNQIEYHSQQNSSNHIQTKTTIRQTNPNQQGLIQLSQQSFSSNCFNIEQFLNYHLTQNNYNNDWLL